MGGNIVIKDKVEVFNTFFTSVFNSKTGCPEDSWLLELVDRDKKLNCPLIIEEERVSNLLSHLDPHKSMGSDGIHPRVMRELAEELAKTLSIIYQQSCLSGDVPDDWKLANVAPIHKKCQKEDPGNSRPVSLTSVPGKNYRSVYKKQIERLPEDCTYLPGKLLIVIIKKACVKSKNHLK
ncbi:hypothetical protein BTVI_53957 [Pitangus sulphuratus]|nr:hypothetical protein BTVI_53957 [Pitangus sulphuratus]